jgi:hypothetical protein
MTLRKIRRRGTPAEPGCSQRSRLSRVRTPDEIFDGAEMSFAAEHVIATFAASIVTARGATSVAAIREAWSDARWILFPEPTDPEYQAWQRTHGEVPGTLQEAEAAALAVAARRRHINQTVQNFANL